MSKRECPEGAPESKRAEVASSFAAALAAIASPARWSARVKGALRGEPYPFGARRVVVYHDFGEDFDDSANMFLYIYGYKLLERSDADLTVVLSGGLRAPEWRLEYLKRTFPELAAVEFGRKVGSLTFHADGALPAAPIDAFLNCGPMCSRDMGVVAAQLRGAAMLVGAKPDGSFAAQVNGKLTDVPGALTADAAVWNRFAADLPNIRVLDAKTSRSVLFPAFDDPELAGTAWAAIPATHPALAQTALDTKGMFVGSRPSRAIFDTPVLRPTLLRLNEANTEYAKHAHGAALRAYQDDPRFPAALEVAGQYAGGDPELFERAVLPIVFTVMLGGVYLPGVFGFNPHEKGEMPCFTPESKPVFRANLAALGGPLTPAYDLCAFLLAALSDEEFAALSA